MSHALAALTALAVAYAVVRDAKRALRAGVPMLLLALPLLGAPTPTVVKLATFTDTTRPYQYVVLRTNTGLAIEIHELSRIIIESDRSVTREFATKPCRLWVSRGLTFTGAGIRIPDPDNDCRAPLPTRITIAIEDGDVSLSTEEPGEPNTQLALGRRTPWDAS